MPTFLQTEITVPSYYKLETPAWLEHGPFAMWLVKRMRPRRIVELGTHYGYSYFAMCEAVEQVGLDTQCFAVDTWVGEEHAGQYGEEVFDAMVAENRKYAHFSTLLRKTFAEALNDIEDGSVDLLHVDGRHFYEDVKEDYKSWEPKLSDRAVVLFHDTMVRDRGFGVYRYWAELAERHPSFNFFHGHGLGVLLRGENVPLEITELVRFSEARSGPGVVEDFFRLAGGIAAERFRSKDREQTLISEVKETKRAAAAQQEQSRLTINKIREEKCVLETHNIVLQQRLTGARRKPVQLLKDKLLYKLLRTLAKSRLPLRPRTRKRFARSADKRNPRRDDFSSPTTREIQPYSYDELRMSWNGLRKEPTTKLLQELSRLPHKPVISVVVPVYNPEIPLLSAMIQSVQNQSYERWELCIADDCSNGEVRNFLSDVATTDSRIKLVLRQENGHISRATNSAINLATGDFLALLDHDDQLDPDALLYVVDTIVRQPDAQIIYTDEDKVKPSGERFSPHFKPDWNRDYLYGINYISHLGVFNANLVRKIGGMREGFEGAQDYDLLLRCIEHVRDSQIFHIPKVLYSWCASPGSTAESNKAKPYAWDAGVRALSEHLERLNGYQVPVSRGPFPFTYRAHWPLRDTPLASIIIPTRDKLEMTKVAVESIIYNTDYPNFEILIVDNGSVEATTLQWFSDLTQQDPRIRVLRDERPFNYSALNNAAVKQSRGDVILLLNNDVETINSDWLNELVSLAIRPWAGCIGAKLFYPDGTIQHGGVIIGIGGVAGHAHLGFPKESAGYFCRLQLRQNYSAVTGACLAVRRSVYEEVGGLNESDLGIAFNDVDFCLKVQAAGYNNVWTPAAQLTHFESASRGVENTPEKRKRFAGESEYMKKTWRTDHFEDPHYNVNLTLNKHDFSFGNPRW